MIDIHSHILPGIDDGARNIEESLDMLKMAIDGGVTTQVLTPHIRQGRYENNKHDLEQRFVKFRQEVDSANLPIQLLLSAELHIGPNIMPLVNSDAIPWLGNFRGKKTFLLEFPRNNIPYGSNNAVKWLLANNYLPIIVHPERNKVFLNQRHKLQDFIDLGCLLQITASSLYGKFKADAQEMAEDLLIKDQVSVIASDCHNVKSRAPDLLAGFKCAERIIGTDRAKQLVETMPANLIHMNPYH